MIRQCVSSTRTPLSRRAQGADDRKINAFVVDTSGEVVFLGWFDSSIEAAMAHDEMVLRMQPHAKWSRFSPIIAQFQPKLTAQEDGSEYSNRPGGSSTANMRATTGTGTELLLYGRGFRELHEFLQVVKVRRPFPFSRRSVGAQGCAAAASAREAYTRLVAEHNEAAAIATSVPATTSLA